MQSKWENTEIYLFKMMERRGFQMDSIEEEEENIRIFKESNKGYKILVWYFKNDKLNIDSIKEFVNILKKYKISNGILIYQQTITASTKKVIENLYQFKIELFEMKEFQYDITQFKYYCHHEKVCANEAQELKQLFKTNLPSLLRTDPIVRYFGFQKGDIIKIIRRNQTIVYRLVK